MDIVARRVGVDRMSNMSCQHVRATTKYILTDGPYPRWHDIIGNGVWCTHRHIRHGHSFGTTAMMEVIADNQMMTLSTRIEFTPSKHTMIANNGHRRGWGRGW